MSWTIIPHADPVRVGKARMAADHSFEPGDVAAHLWRIRFLKASLQPLWRSGKVKVWSDYFSLYEILLLMFIRRGWLYYVCNTVTPLSTRRPHRLDATECICVLRPRNRKQISLISDMLTFGANKKRSVFRLVVYFDQLVCCPRWKLGFQCNCYRWGLLLWLMIHVIVSK